MQGAYQPFSDAPQDWLEPGRNTFCVDYAIGKRWQARQRGATGIGQYRLAALRWPERELCFDDGERVPTRAFKAALA